MQLTRLSIQKPLYTWLLILFCFFGGLAGYLSVGKLEDPVFTLKSALIITAYPGASAVEVSQEVTEVLESELQQMDEVDTITSTNRPGISVIEVEMKDEFDGSELPQVWDDMRDRVDNATSQLPNGVIAPVVNDSFGDVYGLYYAVSAEGYTDDEIWEIATFLRREFLSVEGVANSQILGLPEEAVFIEPSSQLSNSLAVPPDVLLDAVRSSDAIIPTGSATNGETNLRVDAPKPDDTVKEIGALTFGVNGEILSLTDIAKVYRARVDDPFQIIRHNGVAAFTIGIAGLQSDNIINVGKRVEERLEEIGSLLPVGVLIEPIYEQHRVVDTANNDFVVSLALSVGVVILVLAIFMGWRAAIVVGSSLLLTVTFTFFFMALFDVKVERISLGALIIAMGMLVDNAIVVAEGMQIQMKRGRKAIDAAQDVASRTQIPLLGATIIGVMAFAGIGLSPDSSGEFLFSLFAVISISLMLSWLIAVTITPLLSSYFFHTDEGENLKDPYDTVMFRAYASVVRTTLRLRWFVIIGLIGTTVFCMGAFGQVRQQFFPPANTPLFYFNYQAAQGTAIKSASNDLKLIEQWLSQRDDVAAYTTTVGASFTRFLLTYTPENPNPGYGQILIRAKSFDAIPKLRDELDDFAKRTIPWAESQVQQIIYGPPVTADVEVRFSGPDPDILRSLAQEAQTIFETQTSLLQTERKDWRERELVTRPIYATDRAQALGIRRTDVAQAIALATDGIRAGTFRERDRLIPITLRTPLIDQTQDGQLRDQLVYSPVTRKFTTVEQVVDGFEIIARDTLIERRNRVPTVSVQAFVEPNILPTEAFVEVRPTIEAITLPSGYRMEWGGEFESAGEAQQNLGKQMPLAFGTMLLITILLFGKLRQTAVIWTIVPMAVNGAALGLLFTGLPFSFTAMLGLLSLTGMLIKNAIVLVEEIDSEKTENGLPQSEAIVKASVSRLRPIVLAATTTILGMVPLLWDVFFASMAVTIMAGLGFASILTLIGVPALYHTYLRRERLEEQQGKVVKSKQSLDESGLEDEPGEELDKPFKLAAE